MQNAGFHRHPEAVLQDPLRRRRLLLPLFGLLLAGVFCSCDHFSDPVSASPEPEPDVSDAPAYPVKPFLSYRQISHGEPFFLKVQDFDLAGDDFFFHPLGPHGLYRHSMKTYEMEELVRYHTGDFIAHDSIFVFYEMAAPEVYRYNLEKDSTDLRIDLFGLGVRSMGGLEVYGGDLYVLGLPEDQKSSLLMRYDLDGHLQEIIPVPVPVFYITIYEGIVFSRGEGMLKRFSLASRTFLSDLPLPSPESDGMRIIDGFFYFTDFVKEEIDVFLVSEVMD